MYVGLGYLEQSFGVSVRGVGGYAFWFLGLLDMQYRFCIRDFGLPRLTPYLRYS